LDFSWSLRPPLSYAVNTFPFFYRPFFPWVLPPYGPIIFPFLHLTSPFFSRSFQFLLFKKNRLLTSWTCPAPPLVSTSLGLQPLTSLPRPLSWFFPFLSKLRLVRGTFEVPPFPGNYVSSPSLDFCLPSPAFPFTSHFLPPIKWKILDTSNDFFSIFLPVCARSFFSSGTRFLLFAPLPLSGSQPVFPPFPEGLSILCQTTQLPQPLSASFDCQMLLPSATPYSSLPPGVLFSTTRNVLSSRLEITHLFKQNHSFCSRAYSLPLSTVMEQIILLFGEEIGTVFPRKFMC